LPLQSLDELQVPPVSHWLQSPPQTRKVSLGLLQQALKVSQ